jgi:hypothetical protein
LILSYNGIIFHNATGVKENIIINFHNTFVIVKVYS